ncbi:hypothetical protein NQ315_014994 [Exocentrus adspersus]|uniref:Ig-like domain-containing protein n=1 Tax=Exocentrus adspersus TaxID=1586481 RepID=A0AAV8VXB4_9CUCU|nr:hypothetical protein NQ315_014994 [Exocentrus adspersus]
MYNWLQKQKAPVSPMIWVPNQLVGAPAGTDVTIDCHTEAYPRAISYWVYDNVMLLPTKKYGTETMENSYRAHMKLTVRNLQTGPTGDFGNYRCISKNSLGETEGSIRLYGCLVFKDIETNVVLNQYIQHPVSFKGKLYEQFKKRQKPDMQGGKKFLGGIMPMGCPSSTPLD